MRCATDRPYCGCAQWSQAFLAAGPNLLPLHHLPASTATRPPVPPAAAPPPRRAPPPRLTPPPAPPPRPAPPPPRHSAATALYRHAGQLPRRAAVKDATGDCGGQVFLAFRRLTTGFASSMPSLGLFFRCHYLLSSRIDPAPGAGLAACGWAAAR